MDFNVKNDYEYVGNYKELQQALNKTGTKKVGTVGCECDAQPGCWPSA